MSASGSSYIYSPSSEGLSSVKNLDWKLKGLTKFIQLVDFLAEILILNFSFYLCFYFKYSNSLFLPLPQPYKVLLIFINLLALLINFIPRNNVHRISKKNRIVSRTLKSSILNALILIGLLYFIKEYSFSRQFIILFYITTSGGIIVWKFIYNEIIKIYRIKNLNPINVILFGNLRTNMLVKNFINKNSEFSYNIIEVFNWNPKEEHEAERFLERIKDLNCQIDELFCTIPLKEEETLKKIRKFTDIHLIQLRVVPDLHLFHGQKFSLEYHNNRIPVLSPKKSPLEDFTKRALKRSFDICFSLFVLIFLFPFVFLIIAPLIKFSSKGPIFFKQIRSGYYNKNFLVYKFRTMTVNNESDSKQATRNDVRVTKIGKFLRRTNLDEVPQFINVLLGDMSIVGPRPHLLIQTQKFPPIIDKYMIRHHVKPGISGWAQINGYRGGTQEYRQMYKRIQYDVWYVENFSFALDLKIILLTVYNIFIGEENAY